MCWSLRRHSAETTTYNLFILYSQNPRFIPSVMIIYKVATFAPKATGIKTRSSQPSQPVSQYSDVMVAAPFKHIQPAVSNKPQLDKSGDTATSRTSDLRVDFLTIVNSGIISLSADHHPLLAMAPVFTLPAPSPSANLAADTIINVFNTRINRQSDTIKRATIRMAFTQ